MSSLRAFFTALFAVAGAFVGLILIFFAFYGIASLTEEDSLDSGVKIMADANGNRKKLDSEAPVLLQIHLSGQIGKDEVKSSKIEEILLKSREDKFKEDRVKGILLVIDSPGGSVNDSDIIYRALRQYKERYNVPVFAFANGLCASGGYYIACASDKIYASDVSLVGSVGVLWFPPFINISETLKKIGADPLTLYAGKDKDAMNILRPWKEGETTYYQGLIDAFYDHFTRVVTVNRPAVDPKELVDNYGAKLFPAAEAQKIGFIDVANANLSQVIAELAVAAGIEKETKYQVIAFETRNWWQRTFKSESPFMTGSVKHELILPGLNGESNFIQYLHTP